jgi:uncharacterized protein YfbU (UPF0304 family)
VKNHAASGRLALTPVERLLLANQYAILERLDPARQHEYAVKREIVERGEADHYDALLDQPMPTVRRSPGIRRIDDHLNRLATDRGGALTPW